MTIARTLNVLLMFALPLALAIWLRRRFGLPWRLFLIGMVTFILSQVVHLPLNAVLGRLGLFALGPEPWRLAATATLLGLSAGLCEELARYLGLRYWRRAARSRPFTTALMFGAGHGGVEAMLVGAITALTTVQLIALQSVDLNTLGLTAEQLAALQAQLAAFNSAPWPLALIGALERLFSIVVHLALTVMVMQALTGVRGRWWWLGAAILWHALTNAVAVYLLQSLGGPSSIPAILWSEAAVGVMALASLAIILALRRPEPPAPEPAALAPLPLPEPARLAPPPLTNEALERTQYE